MFFPRERSSDESGGSRGEPRRRDASPARGEGGATILELIVSLSLLAVIALIFHESYVGALRAGQFLESHGDLTRIGQKAVNELKAEIVQSRRIFQNDAVGATYAAGIRLPADIVRQPDARLPLIDVNGQLKPDSPGQTRTGNSLLLARQLPPLEAPVDLDGDGQIDPVRILVDQYQFKYFFLARDTGRSFARLGYWVDLLEADSAVFADYFQLSTMPDQMRQQVGRWLVTVGVQLAWNAGQPLGSAIYSIANDGTLQGPLPNATLSMGNARSLVAQIHGGRVSGSMAYSVAMITTPPIPSPDPIWLYGQPAGAFPGGFEVLVAGPTGAQKSVLRLVLLSDYGGKIDSQVSSVVVTSTQI